MAPYRRNWGPGEEDNKEKKKRAANHKDRELSLETESFNGYREAGQTNLAEAIYQSPDGVICVEKDYTRLVLASGKEIEDTIIN